MFFQQKKVDNYIINKLFSSPGLNLNNQIKK